jgi:hypothetical protein
MKRPWKFAMFVRRYECTNVRVNQLQGSDHPACPLSAARHVSVKNGFEGPMPLNTPSLAWSAPSDTHGKKNTFYVASASGCYGCYLESLSCLINHLSSSLWSGIPAPHQSHSSTWPTMHMRLPSAPISSFHDLGMMRKLDQSSQKRRELWLGLLLAKGLPTTTTLQLTGFMI